MTAQESAIHEIMSMPDVTITPAVAAKAIGCDPQWIRLVAKTDPERLGFRIIRLNSRVKIPRIPFLQYLGVYKEQEAQGND